MHIKGVRLFTEDYPVPDQYPFNLTILQNTEEIVFDSPVTLLVGENGAGKSTLIEAVARKCGIHIWDTDERTRYEHNPYEALLHRYIAVQWQNGPVPGSFFAGEIFKSFAKLLDEWASTDPGQLKYFGGKSLMTLSHGQSLMAFFQSRYQIEGLYLLDEPETALSPRSQVVLTRLLRDMSRAGHAQFIVATHSPILLACPGARIYNFNGEAVSTLEYEQTDHFRLYKDFLSDPEKYLYEMDE